MSSRERIKSVIDTVSAEIRRRRMPTFTGPAIQAATTRGGTLSPSPIDPTWIQGGSPTACAATLTRSGDGLLSSGVWECQAGTFDFFYESDEIVHILEGEVTVSHGGQSHKLRPGDVAFFPMGLTAHWVVPKYVRKFCIHRATGPSLLGRLRSRLGM